MNTKNRFKMFNKDFLELIILVLQVAFIDRDCCEVIFNYKILTLGQN